MTEYNIWSANDAITIQADSVYWDQDMVYMYQGGEIVFAAPKLNWVVRKVRNDAEDS